MKKLLGILVLGLLWCNVSVAKEIWLECIFNPGKGHSGFVNSFIIDEANQTLIQNGIKQFVVEFDHRFIRFKGDAKDEDFYEKTLDRISGTYDGRFKCKVVRKTLF